MSSVNGDTVDASVQVFDRCARITRLGGQHAVPSWPSQPLRTYRIISSKFHLKRNENRIISDLVLHVFLCTPHHGSLNRRSFSLRLHGSCQIFYHVFFLNSFLRSVCSRFVSFIRISPSSRRLGRATTMNRRQI